MPDGDDAGTQLATQALPLLAYYRFTRLVKLEGDRQPTDCTPNELHGLLTMDAEKIDTAEKHGAANVATSHNVSASNPITAGM